MPGGGGGQETLRKRQFKFFVHKQDFLMFHYQNGAPLLHISHGPLGLFLEDRGYVRRYEPLLTDLDHLALDRGQSREFLAGMASEFEQAVAAQDSTERLAR